MESTLLQFGIKTNFLKLFRNKMYMAIMVCHVIWENENVMLKDDKCISKAKGHHNIFRMVVMSFEHYLPIITFLNVH
jgi:hypothetical protein